MDIYYGIKQQRKEIVAPVDHLGCCKTPETTDDETRKFQILISLVLSSQTKDEVTHAAVLNLNERLKVLSAESVMKASVEEINGCIGKVGYHNKKAKYIKEIAQKISENGMPKSLQETLVLPGVGKKMAFLYLLHAQGKCEGIGVDIHVHRISNRIGLVSTKNEEQTRLSLQSKLPLSEWSEINEVLVGFGQTICLPLRPKCKECRVSELCPSSILNAKKASSKTIDAGILDLELK